ncbi:transcription termination factor Rho [Nonomuraea maritima]|uniref:Transcription termination factor Rho n=1 Tax=Nonomuraea maritima TaxID=683260 RepID=A0A1G9RYX8_9ACTN|nr:transcription termination factor Rho [Nonomuraea maritima]SDM28364.1 transcription termination factor Rho [Nonomuraea maritima]
MSTRTENRTVPEQRPAPGAAVHQVSGLLDVHDKSIFIRAAHLPQPGDVRLPPEKVRQYALRPGDHVVASFQGNKLVGVDEVNGGAEWRERPNFANLTPVHPTERLTLETESLSTRVVDLFAPIGKGQRGLIVAPPKAGKTMVLQALAAGISRNHPEVTLMVVLVGERPEEVTEMRSTIPGEIYASTFDHPDRDHAAVAELAVERAKRLVESGRDVVLLLDSLTRLGRAYNNLAPGGGRVLTGGIDARALYPPKRFFGAARNVEGGGSLTILATALVDTGSRMDNSLYEEFKGTGNMELHLTRELAERRLFPAVDLDASGTRREEILLKVPEQQVVWRLRRMLTGLDRQQGMELLVDRLRKTPSNAAFLHEAAAA